MSVNFKQLDLISNAIKNSNSKVFIGYNRPFSKAVSDLIPFITDNPFTINCFISGHFLDSKHWYRDPKQGSRICGNMGHWIDLALFLFSFRGEIPKTYDVSITHANQNDIDDNLNVTFTTPKNDIVSITLSSRSEPFEGISETINILNGDAIININDFRNMTINKLSTKKRYNYWPKDVGHKSCILQPFNEKRQRNINDIILSTRLMLEIYQMNEMSETRKQIILK